MPKWIGEQLIEKSLESISGDLRCTLKTYYDEDDWDEDAEDDDTSRRHDLIITMPNEKSYMQLYQATSEDFDVTLSEGYVGIALTTAFGHSNYIDPENFLYPEPYNEGFEFECDVRIKKIALWYQKYLDLNGRYEEGQLEELLAILNSDKKEVKIEKL